MPGSPAPWLADLPDEWMPQPQELPAKVENLAKMGTLRSIKVRPDGHSTRNGLSELSQNAQNTRHCSARRGDNGRFDTIHSVDSVVRYDTVERGSSPNKKETELEWKRRLVDNDLGYGDQTELFGPSGLENIFQSPAKSPDSAAKRPSRLRQQVAMPSSPPPWPIEMEDEAALREGEDVAETRRGGSCADESVFTERKVSGQTDVGDETFSPVYISKHTTLDGEIGYTALDSEAARMMQKSSVLSHHSSHRGHAMQVLQSQQDDTPVNLMDDSIPQVEISLPDNLPTGTPPVAKLGNFVNVKRGGLSNCGSFKTRPLSPSVPDSRKPSAALTAIRTQNESAMEDSQQQGVVDGLPSAPQTPEREVASSLLKLPTSRSGGSPLKLFGAYDTFTNTRLLRRLSQLEDPEKANGTPDEPDAVDPDDHEDDISADDDETNVLLEHYQDDDVDEQDFEADLSFGSAHHETSDGLSRDGSPEPNAHPPGARSPFAFQLDECDHPQGTFGVKRKLSDRSTKKSRKPITTSTINATIRDGDRESFQSQASILPLQSPVAAPTPKRQRTLHRLDLETDCAAPRQNDYSDSLHDDSVPTAVILGQNVESSYVQPQARPRNPTPHQRRQSEVDTSDDRLISSPKLQAIRESIEESNLPGSLKLVSQAKAVANDLATFTLNVTKHDGDAGDRKRSITTQDFLDEAMHIMSLIRARGRPQSGLGSVQESNEDSHVTEQQEQLPVERSPSVLRVSRPPSREGPGSGWRPRSQPQRDAQVASKLQQFQEKDDIEILDATLHSLRLKGLPLEDEEEAEAEEEVDDSDVTNGSGSIRIRRSVRRTESQTNDVAAEEQVDSLKSNGSAAYSTGRTQGTNSTRKSDNVATLAPETVAHLIPEEVAGMTFDRTQGKWVRMRQEKPKTISRASPYPASNITSDDDPFGNIPDLTVDEYRELQQVSSSQNTDRQQSPSRMHAHARQSSQDDTTFAQTQHHPAMKSSTAPGHTNFGTPQVAETRATSYASQDVDQPDPKMQLLEQRIAAVDFEERSDPFDLEDAPRLEQLRSVRLDFGEGGTIEQEALDQTDSVVEELPVHQPTLKHNRRVSFQTQTFQSRRRGQDVEQSEMSIIAEMPDKRVVSVSVAVSKPLANHEGQLSQHGVREVSSDVILSDLPEFTVAELDDAQGLTEKCLSATVAHHGLEVANDRYALAIQDMVKTLTNVKGDEPFWEDIRQLALRKQNVQSLHGLDEFCVRLQQLDIADNQLDNLHGAPATLRWLDASRNTLTSLTAWNQLQNLQYLDISHNNVESLDGLGCLIHLREVRAGHNKLTSLEGLEDLDGLIKVHLDHNEIDAVDFSHCHWPHLQSINLASNKIASVRDVNLLPSLETITLDNNKLSHFDLATEGRMQIKELSLANNQLQIIDVRAMDQLRYLDLDGNCLTHISGLSDLKYLDVLSIRRQRQDRSNDDLWSTIFASPIHARSVYMSSNALPEHPASNATQNTISHLELASCGLLSLPPDFGLRFPNLRHLNLNTNALKDIRPILNIEGLETLQVAGNRLSRLRKCIETLAHLTSISHLDLRDNPITQGFYPAKGVDEKVTALNGTLTRHGDLRLDHNAADESSEAIQERKAAAYSLQTVSAHASDAHEKLMDQDTRLRRRVYDILLASSCGELKKLDSLEFDRTKARQRDQAWNRLRELGVLKRKP